MKNHTAVLLGLAGLFTSILNTALAHPASGIVVDPKGNVLFIYRGVCKLDPQGRLSYLRHTTDGHWMCLDPEGSFHIPSPSISNESHPMV